MFLHLEASFGDEWCKSWRKNFERLWRLRQQQPNAQSLHTLFLFWAYLMSCYILLPKKHVIIGLLQFQVFRFLFGPSFNSIITKVIAQLSKLIYAKGPILNLPIIPNKTLNLGVSLRKKKTLHVCENWQHKARLSSSSSSLTIVMNSPPAKRLDSVSVSARRRKTWKSKAPNAFVHTTHQRYWNLASFFMFDRISSSLLCSKAFVFFIFIIQNSRSCRI